MTVTQGELIRLRLAAQQLAVRPESTPAGVVGRLGAVQAQDYRHALWAIGLRLPGSTEAAVEAALREGAIARTWLLRGTLHLVAAADLRPLLALVAPRVIAARAGRRRQLGIDRETLARSRQVLEGALSGGGALLRDEAYGALRAAGVATDGQRGIHILSELSLEGLLCQTTAERRQSAFVLLDEWLPASARPDRDETLAGLAERYFAGHGPATLRDFAWWSGLTLTEARTGLDAARTRVALIEFEGSEYWVARDAEEVPARRQARKSPAPLISLLPGYDEFIIGYQDRRVVLNGYGLERIVPGGNGAFQPAIAVDGRVVGIWRLGTIARAASVAELFEPTDAALAPDAPLTRRVARALRDHDAFVRGDR